MAKKRITLLDAVLTLDEDAPVTAVETPSAETDHAGSVGEREAPTRVVHGAVVRPAGVCKNPRYLMAGINGQKIFIDVGKSRSHRFIGKEVRVRQREGNIYELER